MIMTGLRKKGEEAKWCVCVCLLGRLHFVPQLWSMVVVLVIALGLESLESAGYCCVVTGYSYVVRLNGKIVAQLLSQVVAIDGADR